jgi:hypothetical protein
MRTAATGAAGTVNISAHIRLAADIAQRVIRKSAGDINRAAGGELLKNENKHYQTEAILHATY